MTDSPPGAELTRRARLAAYLLALLWALLLRLQRMTWRVTSERLDELDERLRAGQTLVLAFWHGKYLPLFALLAGRRAVVFTSRSFRGAVIAGICRRFGYRAVALPERGQAAGLAAMRAAATAGDGVAVGVAADGPLGPPRRAKAAVVRLASELGCPVLPASVAARRKRVLAKRWDRREIPALGTRLTLVVGPPLAVPPGLDTTALREWEERLGAAIERADRRAEALVAGAGAPGATPLAGPD